MGATCSKNDALPEKDDIPQNKETVQIDDNQKKSTDYIPQPVNNTPNTPNKPNKPNICGKQSKYDVFLSRHNIPPLYFNLDTLQKRVGVVIDDGEVFCTTKEKNKNIVYDVIVYDLYKNTKLFLKTCDVLYTEKNARLERIVFIKPGKLMTKKNFLQISNQMIKNSIVFKQIFFGYEYIDRILPESSHNDIDIDKRTAIMKQFFNSRFKIEIFIYQTKDNKNHYIPTRLVQIYGYQIGEKDEKEEKKENKEKEENRCRIKLSPNYEKECKEFCQTMLSKTDFQSFAIQNEPTKQVEYDPVIVKINDDDDDDVEYEIAGFVVSSDSDDVEDDENQLKCVLFDVYEALYYILHNHRTIEIANKIHGLANNADNFEITKNHLINTIPSCITEIKFIQKDAENHHKNAETAFEVVYDEGIDRVSIKKQASITIYFGRITNFRRKYLTTHKVAFLVSFLHELVGHVKRYLCSTTWMYGNIVEIGYLVEDYVLGFTAWKSNDPLSYLHKLLSPLSNHCVAREIYSCDAKFLYQLLFTLKGESVDKRISFKRVIQDRLLIGGKKVGGMLPLSPVRGSCVRLTSTIKYKNT